MAALPTIENTVAQVKAPTSRVSPGQVAEPYSELAATLNQISSETGDIAKRYAREAGLKAVTRDADGNVQVQNAPIFGDAALEYGHAVKVAALADGEGEARRGDIRLRQEFRDNPEKYLVAADAYRKEKIAQYSKAAGTEVGIALGKAIDQQTTLTYKGLLNEKEKLELDRSTMSIQTEISQTENELYSIAFGGITSGPEWDRRVAKIAALRGQLTGNPRIAYPQERANFDNDNMISTLKATAAAGNIERIYKEQGPDAAMKAANDYLTDTSLKLTPQQRQQYNAKAIGVIRDLQRDQNLNDKAITSAIDDVNKRATEGYRTSDADITQIRHAIATNKNPALNSYYKTTLQNMDTLQEWRRLSPAQLGNQLDRLERQMNERGADDTSKALLKNGRDLQKTMNKEIKEDPLGWMNRTGTADVPPIDFTAKEAPLDMRGRIAIAEMGAQYYGQPPVYLRPEEVRQLELTTSTNGSSLMTAAKNIADGFGDRSPAVLNQVRKDAPMLSHLGGLLSGSLFGGGSVTFAGDVANAVTLMADPEKAKTLPHWMTKPTDKTYTIENARTVEQYGDAFIMAPETGRNAEMSAKMAFGVRALRTGMSIDEVERGGTKSRKGFNDALQEGAGAKFVNNQQFGGVTDFRASGSYPWSWTNRKVLVPSNIRADMFKDVIGKITDDDLSRMPVAPRYTARQLQQATPVAVSGGYSFAVGDPSSGDPKWVQGEDGKRFVLRLDAMEPELRKRIPAAYGDR